MSFVMGKETLTHHDVGVLLAFYQHIRDMPTYADVFSVDALIDFLWEAWSSPNPSRVLIATAWEILAEKYRTEGEQWSEEQMSRFIVTATCI